MWKAVRGSHMSDRVAFATLLILAVGLCEFGLALDESEYYDKLEEINYLLDHIDKQAKDLCPLSPLVTTCGNNICEHLWENGDNCPADCVITPVKSYDHQVNCAQVEQLLTPASLDELIDIVKSAHLNGTHVRVVGSRHTVNQQYCTNGIAISMDNFKTIIGIEKEPDGSESVMVQPSVIMADLGEWLHERDRSLGYAQLGFRAATIAGAIANGAHGSSPKHTSVLSSLVRSATIVKSDGHILEISDSDP